MLPSHVGGLLALLACAVTGGIGGCALAPQAADAGQRGDSRNVEGRQRFSLNEGWRFRYGDRPGAEESAGDAAGDGWQGVDLPHTWNRDDAWDDTPGYLRGVGWYRRSLRIPQGLSGHRLFLRFEGANQATDVFVNGRPVGRHQGGYTAFVCDVTEAVQRGGDNVLAVKVDNSLNRSIPPLSADFTFYGGIYRDVWLIATAPIHFDMSDHGSTGLYVDTPRVSVQDADVRIRGALCNTADRAKDVRVVTTVRDASGAVVRTLENRYALDAGARKPFGPITTTIAEPHLWSPDDPYLYSLVCESREGDRVLDRLESPLGFRWFSFDPNKGFFLNGKSLKLIGVNRHQDRAGIGNALSNDLHTQDIETIKAMGANFLRLAHYPQDPAVLDAADRLGLILWEEIPIVNYVTPSETFAANCRTMLIEMIRQHYNHPAVLMWGYMNEVFLYDENGQRAREGIKNQEYAAWTVGLARELDALARREDPTRVTVMAAHSSEVYNDTGMADVPQVLGWNLYQGWYGGTFEGFGAFLDKQHTRYPKRPLIVSEYGAGSDERLHSLKPARFDYSVEWQQRYHESHLDQIEARPFVAGTAVWNQFDFGSEDRGDATPHLNNKGLCTYDRRPKDVYFFYKARLTREPVLHVAAREWTERAAWSDAASVVQPAVVYSNLPEVELFHNGRSLGVKKPGRSCRAEWDVEFQAGRNELTARGLSAGKPIEDRAEVRFRLLSWNRFDELAINVGSDAQFRDETGRIWLPDRPYTPGAWGYENGEASPLKPWPGVLDTDSDPLFQSFREGLSAYRFDVPDGAYEIELYLADLLVKAPGERVFHVRVNGSPPADPVDLVRDNGGCRAASRKFAAVASGGTGIRVSFEVVQGKPLLNAIRVAKSSAAKRQGDAS